MEEFETRKSQEESDEKSTYGEEPAAATEKRTAAVREVFDWVQAIIAAVVIALFIRTFLFTLVRVDGPSMEPTLQNNNILIVTRAGYQPKAGDVIIFRPEKHQDTPYVKRIIATQGQEVDIDPETGDVFVDGVLLEEDYIKEKIHRLYDVKFPVVVPEDCVFVMGDNRNNSSDSRRTDVGMVKNDSIIGKANVRIWPPQEWGKIH